MTSPKVHIIVVNYGTPHDTVECLESIVLNDYKNYRVIIVDIQDKNDF